MENKVNKTDFENNLARLEQIVRKLESGNAPLDESIELYEEGIALVKKCNSALENAEKRIKLLVATVDGVLEKDFEV